MKDTVTMVRGDERAEVTAPPDQSVEIMKAQGWILADEPEAKPSDGMTVAQLKEALAAKGIAIPDGITLKADLAKLLDEAQA
jgi:hypothetical protein